MFKPTHVLTDLDDLTAFKAGTLFEKISDNIGLNLDHPKTGFPCSTAQYATISGTVQTIASYGVDEINKEGV